MAHTDDIGRPSGLFPTIAPLHMANKDSGLILALEKEVRWHAATPRFESLSELAGAVASGRLVELTDTSNVRRLPRFNADIKQAQPGFWPFLAPGALVVAQEFGRLWRSLLINEFGVRRPDVRLPITSLARTVPYQMELVEGGRFASPNSTHTTGWAFDTDNSSYYKRLEDDSWVSCSHPDGREDRMAAAEQIRERYIMDPSATVFKGVFDDEYDPRINEAAHEAAKILHAKDVVNLVLEFPDKPYSVLHQGVNPDVLLNAL